MSALGLVPEITDRQVRQRAVKRLRELNVTLPTFTELADPSLISRAQQAILESVDPDDPVAANLWRVHWFNDEARTRRVDVPGYLVLPEALTGVKAKIVVVLGDRFPMIGAHKVLAAYGCLVPRLVSGRFDPTRDKAIWPSTGNYCRGGVAISRTLGCRGVAVLPTGMSRERFDWLERWVGDKSDIIRTPGTESNVKEIYDKCAEISTDPSNVIVNQFSEFSNYLIHYHCTGKALERVYPDLRTKEPRLRLSAFVAATGSAGTIGAGDYLKSLHGTKIAAVEAIECPTMLMNGYGEHNIQGIGDKHIPLIHNVMNTDLVAGVSDRSSDALNVLFNDGVGREYLSRRQKIAPALVKSLDNLGLSSIANIVAAIKIAKRLELGASDAIVTIATDGAALYDSERASFLAREYSAGFDEVHAGEIFGQHVQGIADDHLIELTHVDRRRIFNLGYYTWVEQQGVSVEDFDRRKDPAFWTELQATIPAWDKLIRDFNEDTGRGMPPDESYLDLRRKLTDRDRSLHEKVVTLEEAATLVKDGETVGIGGSTLSRTPMAMIWSLIRARKKRLTCARGITSSEGDWLFGSGVCEHMITSWFSQGIVWGVSKVMRHYTEGGKARFDEWSHMAMGMRFRAGAMGLPFLPMRSMLGSDVVRQRPEVREMDCPYTGDKLLLVPALNPDVALIHVQRCDAYGNAQMDGLQFLDIDLAMAANRVILTTERIVSNDQIRRAPDRTRIPFFAVEAVVEVPYGCAPHECGGAYEPLFRHMDYYTGLVNKDPVGGMAEYLERFVYGPKSWTAYLNLLGLDHLLEAARGGQSISNA